MPEDFGELNFIYKYILSLCVIIQWGVRLSLFLSINYIFVGVRLSLITEHHLSLTNSKCLDYFDQSKTLPRCKALILSVSLCLSNIWERVKTLPRCKALILSVSLCLSNIWERVKTLPRCKALIIKFNDSTILSNRIISEFYICRILDTNWWFNHIPPISYLK